MVIEKPGKNMPPDIQPKHISMTAPTQTHLVDLKHVKAIWTQQLDPSQLQNLENGNGEIKLSLVGDFND